MKVKKLKELIKKFGGDPTGKNTVAACVDALCACNVGAETVYLSPTGQWDEYYHPDKKGASLTQEEVVELVNKWIKGSVQVRRDSSTLYMGGGYSAALLPILSLDAQDSSGIIVSVKFCSAYNPDENYIHLGNVASAELDI